MRCSTKIGVHNWIVFEHRRSHRLLNFSWKVEKMCRKKIFILENNINHNSNNSKKKKNKLREENVTQDSSNYARLFLSTTFSSVTFFANKVPVLQHSCFALSVDQNHWTMSEFILVKLQAFSLQLHSNWNTYVLLWVQNIISQNTLTAISVF